ncbi:MAG: hypothetical protein JWN61_959 [Pseudonocardiales bacterium]|nr:hypothetical protein [Pseudonocardiales bacterium]
MHEPQEPIEVPFMTHFRGVELKDVAVRVEDPHRSPVQALGVCARRGTRDRDDATVGCVLDENKHWVVPFTP